MVSLFVTMKMHNLSLAYEWFQEYTTGPCTHVSQPRRSKVVPRKSVHTSRWGSIDTRTFIAEINCVCIRKGVYVALRGSGKCCGTHWKLERAMKTIYRWRTKFSILRKGVIGVRKDIIWKGYHKWQNNFERYRTTIKQITLHKLHLKLFHNYSLLFI